MLFNAQKVGSAFEQMGARIEIAPAESWRQSRLPFLNIVTDRRRGELFTAQVPEGAELFPLDVRPRDRHLLLLGRNGRESARYFCGHDERHWFVAGVGAVSTVLQAMDALKPRLVLEAERGLRSEERYERHNSARLRQGEWFFVPVRSGSAPTGGIIELNAPIPGSRGRKPHVGSELLRLPRRDFGATREIFARGRVRHPDHKTLKLDGWHRVLPNTELASSSIIGFIE